MALGTSSGPGGRAAITPQSPPIVSSQRG